MTTRHSLPRLSPSRLLTSVALFTLLSLVLPHPTVAQRNDEKTPEQKAHAEWIRSHYAKAEVEIPMRDGSKLWTAVYTPNDASEDNRYPILMIRTPYRVDPYGAADYRDNLGPSKILAEKGYIFVYQDVRGRNMSDGLFVNMTPHRPVKDDPTDVDESSDTYDTIEWLVKHVPHNNGKVGQWGISYPGFYTAAGMIDSHPALKAASPQAPIADWFFDDFHHHGAFFLPHTFNFFASFGIPREGKTTERGERFDHGTPDGYSFFLNAGTWKELLEKHLGQDVPFLTLAAEHPNYDAFWQSRNILPHLSGVTTAVLTVGGWFDAEDLYGPLQIYRSVEAKNPRADNKLVMGPWSHGGWARTTGRELGDADFGFETSAFYQENIEAPFFEHHLKGAPDPKLPEAYVFETGANRWRRFDTWPPEELTERSLYLHEGQSLQWDRTPSGNESYDRFISDPAKPVPYAETIDPGMVKPYMTADQRFAARRPDVLVYRTEPLKDDVTLAGPITAELWVSTSESAADWVVKVIDVLPPDAPDPDPNPTGVRMGEYQMMVRSEVIRGRFRNSYETPEPFTPDTPTRIELPLQDVLHTFRRGHRIMVQIQSTWFPLVDLNPQRYVPNIFEAEPDDYVTATHRVYRDPEHPTRLVVGVLPHPLH